MFFFFFCRLAGLFRHHLANGGNSVVSTSVDDGRCSPSPKTSTPQQQATSTTSDSAALDYRCYPNQPKLEPQSEVIILTSLTLIYHPRSNLPVKFLILLETWICFAFSAIILNQTVATCWKTARGTKSTARWSLGPSPRRQSLTWARTDHCRDLRLWGLQISTICIEVNINQKITSLSYMRGGALFRHDSKHQSFIISVTSVTAAFTEHFYPF